MMTHNREEGPVRRGVKLDPLPVQAKPLDFTSRED